MDVSAFHIDNIHLLYTSVLIMNQNHNENLYWYLCLVEQGLLEFKINLVSKMLNLNSMILFLFKYET